MTPEEKIWLEQAETAVAGASILSNESARDVSKHALRELFKLTKNNTEQSLNLVRQIKDFSARRHLMEMFRRTLVEVSSSNVPAILLDTGSLTDPIFANKFDRELLNLWRSIGKEPKKFEKIVGSFPNAARVRILNRLNSRAFKRRRKIHYVVDNSLFSDGGRNSKTINLLTLLIFLIFLSILFGDWF